MEVEKRYASEAERRLQEGFRPPPEPKRQPAQQDAEDEKLRREILKDSL